MISKNFVSKMLNWLSPNEVRKVTRGNIASLFAALMHLMDVSKVDYRQRLLSFAGIVYNRILVIFDLDARSLITELKLVRRWFMEYIRNGDLTNPGLPEERWDETNGCPFLLSGIDELWETIYQEDNLHYTDFASQSLFTLLSIDRIIVVPARPNFSSITDPCNVNSGDLPSEEDIRIALSRLGITPDTFKAQYAENVHNFQYEVLSTRGPNGDATWTAHLDARAWSSNSELLLSFRSFLEESGLPGILNNLLGCIRSALHEAIPNLNPVLGKLAVIEEWGGKARIVAQLDYWTQMAMTPLHNTINHFLRLLPADGTFNQHAVADRVRGWTTDPNLAVYCYDLTTATDRLPISLQERILTVLMKSSSFAANWADILVGREFLTPNGDMIQYSTGQPMGARSSFPMLALTHHVIIQLAAMRAEVSDYRDYAVLGDDSSLTNGAVSAQYLDLMRVLDVPINLTKSIVHVDGSIAMAEICKRVFMQGIEISRFNPKLIVNVIRDPRLAPDLQNDLFIRGWSFGSDAFWTFLAGLIPREDLTTMVKLNIAPIATTGLLYQYTPSTTLTDLSTWIPGYTDLKPEHLVELFTYITASEALKRLDTLLRSTVTINDSLAILAAANANPKAIPQYVRDDWLRQDLSEEELARLREIIDGAGPITPNHPIVLASRAEANRISELLHSLNSMDTEMVQRARLGLLDTFRTSVSSIWLDTGMLRGGENRALFHRMLSTLVMLFTNDKRVEKGKRNLSLTYSVVLSTLNRLWSVSITLGQQCMVNALRSAVTRNITNANASLDTVLSELTIIPSQTSSTTPPPPASKRAVKRRQFVRRVSKKSPPWD